MVKSVLGVNHQGLRDWFIQRVSAILMAIYTIGMVFFVFSHSGLDFTTWHALFAHMGVKVATLLVLLALLYHAWVGIWTVFTDYIKPSVLCLILNTLVLLALIAFFLAGLLILWGV